MADFFEKYKEQAKKLWSNLNSSLKIVVIIVVVLMSAFFGYLIIRGTSTDYQPLFADLSTSDAAGIVEIIEENNIDYQLTNGGSTILVPEDEVHRLRLEAADQGFPTQGVVGFEIFDSSDFGTTEFEREVNYYRALGGELSRSIQTMDGISFAKVQISPAEESLFLAEEKNAGASVILELERGFNLSSAQIRAVQNLVAGGVQDLPLEEVTIVDTRGNLLSENSSGDDWSSNGGNYAMKQQFEESLTNDLDQMLIRVVGPDNFVVRVNAELDFDQRQAENRIYTPVNDEDGIIRSEEVNTESQQGASGAEGTPGTDANIPQYQAEDDAQGDSYESENRITNYEINERIEQHVYAPGEVQKLSVSLLVDQNTDEETLTQIREAVAAAIGFDEERGDNINVSAINFDRSLENAAEESRTAQAAAERRELYIYGGLILLILLLTSGLIIFLYRKRSAPAGKGSQIDVSVAEDEEEEAIFKADPEQKKQAKLKKELENIVHSDPESAAKLIRSWLVDE
ncbi:MAG: flagellar basal-body MS-ring/collar protein FliF [Halanaerobium sp.]